MSEAVVDVSAVLDRQKITGFNIGLVILAFLVMMTDGYDLGAAAFAGPGLIKEWGLRGPELGILLSSSLAAGLCVPLAAASMMAVLSLSPEAGSSAASTAA